MAFVGLSGCSLIFGWFELLKIKTMQDGASFVFIQAHEELHRDAAEFQTQVASAASCSGMRSGVLIPLAACMSF